MNMQKYFYGWALKKLYKEKIEFFSKIAELNFETDDSEKERRNC